MPTYRLTLAYDGTDFAGWQSQRAGTARTVQAVVEDALRTLAGGARVAVAGAGRTDAGVHARGQVASIALDAVWDPPALVRALNSLLPADVRALDAAAEADGFHARRDAVGKLYRYVLDTGPFQLPTRRRLAGHVPWTLDETAMRAAAALVVGRRDFASLANSGGSVKTTVRTVLRSELTRESSDAPFATFVYEVEADGFLRKMVRSMVGGLIAAGRGACSLAQLQAALEARDRRAWPAPAPACGLTLVRVRYRSRASGAETGRE
jgi:tRNA pseudouridine38-40 synthase